MYEGGCIKIRSFEKNPLHATHDSAYRLGVVSQRYFAQIGTFFFSKQLTNKLHFVYSWSFLLGMEESLFSTGNLYYENNKFHQGMISSSAVPDYYVSCHQPCLKDHDLLFPRTSTSFRSNTRAVKCIERSSLT